MKKILVFPILFTLFNCSVQNCGELQFDKKNKITYYKGNPYTGSCESYFFSGKIKSIENYKNGKDHGEWKFFYKNSNLKVLGNFNLGKKIGKWQYFFESGSIWKENFYDSIGNKIGAWNEYNQAGDIINSYEIKNN